MCIAPVSPNFLKLQSAEPPPGGNSASDVVFSRWVFAMTAQLARPGIFLLPEHRGPVPSPTGRQKQNTSTTKCSHSENNSVEIMPINGNTGTHTWVISFPVALLTLCLSLPLSPLLHTHSCRPHAAPWSAN